MAISTTIMVYYYNTFFLLLSKNAQLHLTNEELHLIERRTASDKHRLANTMLLYDTGGVGYDKSLFPDKYLTNIRKLDNPFRKKFGWNERGLVGLASCWFFISKLFWMRQGRDVSSMSDEGVFVIQRFHRPYIVRVSPAIYLPYPMAISTTIMVILLHYIFSIEM